MNSSDHSAFWQITNLPAIFRGISVVIANVNIKQSTQTETGNKKETLYLLIGSCYAFNNLSD